MILFLIATAATFSLFGFVIGIWADGFEKLQILIFLGICLSIAGWMFKTGYRLKT